MFIEYEYQRKELYDTVHYYLKLGFHFSYECDYNFFKDNIIKQGKANIYSHTVYKEYEEYKSTINIVIQYMNENNDYINNCINLDSKRDTFIIPTFN